VAGKKVETYVYRMDPERVEEQLELVRIKMRCSEYRAATPIKHARELIVKDEFPKYKHLLDMDKKHNESFGFV
jgi:hypothetical protein